MGQALHLTHPRCTHTQQWTHTLNTHTQQWTHTHTHKHTHTVNTHTHSSEHTHTHTYTHKHTYTYTYTHTHIHIHIYTHTHTHTHTHTRSSRGVRCLAQGHLSRGIAGWRECWTFHWQFLLELRLELATSGLRVRLSNIRLLLFPVISTRNICDKLEAEMKASWALH